MLQRSGELPFPIYSTNPKKEKRCRDPKSSKASSYPFSKAPDICVHNLFQPLVLLTVIQKRNSLSRMVYFELSRPNIVCLLSRTKREWATKLWRKSLWKRFEGRRRLQARVQPETLKGEPESVLRGRCPGRDSEIGGTD